MSSGYVADIVSMDFYEILIERMKYGNLYEV
jgi:hypothetical protein